MKTVILMVYGDDGAEVKFLCSHKLKHGVEYTVKVEGGSVFISEESDDRK